MNFKVKDRIEVIKNYSSFDTPWNLKVGMKGKIIKIDSDGDFIVDWDIPIISSAGNPMNGWIIIWPKNELEKFIKKIDSPEEENKIKLNYTSLQPPIPKISKIGSYVICIKNEVKGFMEDKIIGGMVGTIVDESTSCYYVDWNTLTTGDGPKNSLWYIDKSRCEFISCDDLTKSTTPSPQYSEKSFEDKDALKPGEYVKIIYCVDDCFKYLSGKILEVASVGQGTIQFYIKNKSPDKRSSGDAFITCNFNQIRFVSKFTFRELQIGDKVTATQDIKTNFGKIWKDLTGTIIGFDSELIGVEWDEYVGGINCNGLCSAGYGWYCEDDMISREEEYEMFDVGDIVENCLEDTRFSQSINVGRRGKIINFEKPKRVIVRWFASNNGSAYNTEVSLRFLKLIRKCECIKDSKSLNSKLLPKKSRFFFNEWE